MKLLSFQVKKFRNIVDSGEIKADASVTCLVGKNEAGKSGILEALYLFNPAYDDKFDVDEQYPRWLVVKDRKAGSLPDHAPISVTFKLEQTDMDAVSAALGEGVLTSDVLTVERKYGNETTWSFEWNEKAAIDNFAEKIPETISSLLRNVHTCQRQSKIDPRYRKIGN